MKNLKKVIPVLGLVLAFGLVMLQSAFTPVPEKSKLRIPLFFEYVGSTYSETDYENPSNWVEAESSADCPGAGNLCKIEIESDLLSGTGTMEQRLTAYLSSLDESTDYVDNVLNRHGQKGEQ